MTPREIALKWIAGGWQEFPPHQVDAMARAVIAQSDRVAALEAVIAAADRMRLWNGANDPLTYGELVERYDRARALLTQEARKEGA